MRILSCYDCRPIRIVDSMDSICYDSSVLGRLKSTVSVGRRDSHFRRLKQDRIHYNDSGFKISCRATIVVYSEGRFGAQIRMRIRYNDSGFRTS